MQKPNMKYKIISSGRTWDICYKSFYYGKHDLERKDTVQVAMQKPYIKYKIISSSRSWDICNKSFYYANMNNSKSHCKQEADVRETWKGETWYNSPCKSHISNIKSFLPVEAEIYVKKVWTDGRTRWLQYSPHSYPLYEWGYKMIITIWKKYYYDVNTIDKSVVLIIKP